MKKKMLFSTLLAGALMLPALTAAAPQREAHGRFHKSGDMRERERFERHHGGVIIAPYYRGWNDPFWDPYYLGTGAASNPYVGGIRLDVKPHTGEVFVDGSFAGKVDEYNGALQSLDLMQGGHRIEIRTPGYQTLSFDTYVQPNHTTHYKARLVPLT